VQTLPRARRRARLRAGLPFKLAGLRSRSPCPWRRVRTKPMRRARKCAARPGAWLRERTERARELPPVRTMGDLHRPHVMLDFVFLAEPLPGPPFINRRKLSTNRSRTARKSSPKPWRTVSESMAPAGAPPIGNLLQLCRALGTDPQRARRALPNRSAACQPAERRPLICSSVGARPVNADDLNLRVIRFRPRAATRGGPNGRCPSAQREHEASSLRRSDDVGWMRLRNS
jgi:hypothetical protein